MGDYLLRANLEGVAVDFNAVGFGFVFIEVKAQELFGQGGFAGGAVSNQQDFDFVEGQGFFRYG